MEPLYNSLLRSERNQRRFNDLWRLFETIEPASLIIPKDYQKGSYPGILDAPLSYPTPPHILERNLLAQAVTLNGRLEVPMGHPRDLFCLVQDPDNVHEIIFLPSARHARQWVHNADPVDYAFEMWGGASDGKRGNETPWTSVTKYLETGHDVFAHLLMHADGRRAEHDYWWVRGSNNMLPGVPEEIRWLLSTFKLLPAYAISEIRPVIAQWWT